MSFPRSRCLPRFQQGNLGQVSLDQIPKTGNPQADRLLQSSFLKAVAVGAIAAGAAKAFPGKTIGPLIMGTIAAIMVGVVKEDSSLFTTGINSPAPPK